MKEYKYTIDGKQYNVAVKGIEECVATVEVNGIDYRVEMEPEKEPEKPKVARPVAAAPKPAAPSGAASAKASTANALKAPLPGVIREIKVNVGDEVKAGDTCVVLEAMKMANNLEAERPGMVKAVLVSEGQSVMEGEPLVDFE